MRLPKGWSARIALCASLVGLGGLLTATALANHDPAQPFAGSWSATYDREPTSGSITWRPVGDAEGKAAQAALPPAPENPYGRTRFVCDEPSDWYTGTIVRGSDSGPAVACGRTVNGVTYLNADYHLTGSGTTDGFTFQLTSPTAFTGIFNTYSQNGTWSGTFTGHPSETETGGAEGEDGAGGSGTEQTNTCGAERERLARPSGQQCPAVIFRVKVNGEPTAGRISLDLATAKLAASGRITRLKRNDDLFQGIGSGVVKHTDVYVIGEDEHLKLSIQGGAVYRPAKRQVILRVQVVESDDPRCGVGSRGELRLTDGARDSVLLALCGKNDHRHGWTTIRDVDVDVDIRTVGEPPSST